MSARPLVSKNEGNVSDTDVAFLRTDFRVGIKHSERMAVPHTHADIEFNFLLEGTKRYFFGGRFVELPPRRLALFWAGIPHRTLSFAPGQRFLYIQLPIAWFLNYGVAPTLVSELLSGGVAVAPDDELSSLDAALLERWRGDGASGDAARRRAALLEIEARLHRFTGTARWAAVPDAAGSPVERAALLVTQRFQEELTVAGIAAAVGVHPEYLMPAFRKRCGLSVWDYVTRLRVAHGQRLLLTGDATVERIALECGFGSRGNFFKVFKRVLGETPGGYRARLTGDSSVLAGSEGGCAPASDRA